MTREVAKQRSPRLGANLNRLCISLMDARNASAFLADEAAYVGRWALTREECVAIRQRDYPALVSLGANIYLLAKLGTLDGNGVIFAELYSAARRIKPLR